MGHEGVRLGLALDLGLGVSGRVLGCVQYAVRDAVAPVAAHVAQGAHIGTEARGAAIAHLGRGWVRVRAVRACSGARATPRARVRLGLVAYG